MLCQGLVNDDYRSGTENVSRAHFPLFKKAPTNQWNPHRFEVAWRYVHKVGVWYRIERPCLTVTDTEDHVVGVRAKRNAGRKRSVCDSWEIGNAIYSRV